MNGQQQQHGVFFILFYDPIICWRVTRKDNNNNQTRNNKQVRVISSYVLRAPFFDFFVKQQKKLFVVRSNLKNWNRFGAENPFIFTIIARNSQHTAKRSCPVAQSKNEKIRIWWWWCCCFVLTFVWRWRKDPVRLKVPPLAMTSLRRI